jgi:hypothetical protein
MDVAIFWDSAPCSPYSKWRFGGTYRLHLQNSAWPPAPSWFLARLIFDPEEGGDMFLRSGAISKNMATFKQRFVLPRLRLWPSQPQCLTAYVRVPGYRSTGPGFDSRRYQIFWEVVGLERGPLSLVSTTEELLGRKSSGFGLGISLGFRSAAHATPSISKNWH